MPGHSLFSLALLLLLSARCFAQGGPPMVTDDPGTPGPGNWEINVATLLSAAAARDLVQVPYFDVNYGWGERLQLKIETGWSFVAGQAPADSGAGSVLVGVKYRFLDEAKAGVSVSTYPQFQFHPFYASSDGVLAPSGDSVFLPLEASKGVGQFDLNPEVGLLFGDAITAELAYGLVVAYENLKPLELLFEVHGYTWLDWSGTELLLNAGLRYTVGEHLNLLFALGHTVLHVDGGSTELDGYLGAQLEL